MRRSLLGVVCTLLGVTTGLWAAPAAPARLAKGVLFGVALSGYQTEGGDTTSNWADWQVNHPARVPVEPIGTADDFYTRYKEDIGRAARLGAKAFRLSVEWSRIEPAPGNIDEDAIAHYRAVLREIHRRHLEPIVTLSHFTWPQWIESQARTAGSLSGWEHRPTAEAFASYAGLVAQRLGDLIRYYVTINEPNGIISGGYVVGMYPPGKTADTLDVTTQRSLYRALCGMMFGHAAAYDAIHGADSDARVTSNVAVIAFHGALAGLWDSAALQWLDNTLYFDALDGRRPTFAVGKTCAELYLGFGGGVPELPSARKMDYLALDYYYSLDVAPPTAPPLPYWTFPLRPATFTEALERYAARYPGLDVFVLENGMPTENGNARADGWTREAHLVQHVAALQQAAAAGVPIIGYCYWSLLDNYEWGSYTPRFGLFRVEAAIDPTLRRVPTPAVKVFRQIAKRRGVSGRLLRRYPGP